MAQDPYFKKSDISTSGKLFAKYLALNQKSNCDVLRDLVPFGQFKKRENAHGVVLLLVKLQATCNFTKSNIPPWVYFTFFKLFKWYQIAQRITIVLSLNAEAAKFQEEMNLPEI